MAAAWTATASMAVIALVAAAACEVWSEPEVQPPSGQAMSPGPGGGVRTFDLTAAAATLQLRPGLKVHAWTYNGTVPGPPIKVTEGDLVQVRLHNRLPVGTTIHWHGVAVPNGQDGAAGITQDPVPPGRSATYAFVASTPGTYWYHSHQHGAEQVDRGLYGLLIVRPRASGAFTTDAAVVYDEWPLGLEQGSRPNPGDPSMSAYVTVTVNGRTGPGVTPIRFEAGKPLRLRLLNAGYLVHFVQVAGAPVTIAAFDGHEVTDAPATSDALPLGPGERLDLELIGPAGPAWVRLQDPFPPSAEADLPLLPMDMRAPPGGDAVRVSRPVLDLFTYPARATQPAWPVSAQPDRSFVLRLSESSAASGIRYEINGRTFPDTGTADVTLGDFVVVTIANESRDDHPMHLHGHAFQLLSRDGMRVAGTLVKDTVVVRAHSVVSVGFRAMNPGWWMFHCHSLQHAAGGMSIILRYLGSPRLARLGGVLAAWPD